MSVEVSQLDSIAEVSCMTLIPNPNPEYNYNPTFHIIGTRDVLDMYGQKQAEAFDQLLDLYTREPIDRFKVNILVYGAVKSKGIRDGRVYDSTKIFIHFDFDQECDAIGAYILPLYWGAGDNFSKLSSVKFPFEAVAFFQQIPSLEHKSLKLVLTDIQPKMST